MARLEAQSVLKGMTRLGVHDGSRIEWTAEFDLPEEGSADIELEFIAEVPVHLWAEHDHWEHLQLFARLASPDEEAGATVFPPTSVDELRRATLGAVHRFKAARKQIEKEIAKAASLYASEVRGDLAKELIQGISAAMAELHAGRERLARGVDGEPAKVAHERSLAAEFLSNHALDFLSSLQQCLDERVRGPRGRQDDGPPDPLAALHPHLAEANSREWAYRELRGFLSPNGSDSRELERYVNRASMLKKHFQEVLFLQLDTARVDKHFRSWYAVIAALFAGVWAYPLRYVLTGSSSGVAELGWGLGTSLTILVIMYAIRDHIKETVRTWLTTRIAHGYAGRLTNLRVPARLFGQTTRVARVRESIAASPEERPDPLSPDLHSTRPVMALRYQLRGSIHGDPRLTRQGLDRARLVFRYDLSPVFTRLDDSIKRVPILTKDGGALLFAETARSYRLPVQLTMRYQGRVICERAELVAHKLGLERLDRPFGTVRQEAVAGKTHAGLVGALSWSGVRRR